MSPVQTMRAFVHQRLTAAAEEIFELFERTIAEYEDKLRQQKRLLDAVIKPQVRIHRTDVRLLSASKKDPPQQQDGSPSLDQEDPPEPLHVKQEQQEVCTRQEEVCTRQEEVCIRQEEVWTRQEEADITKFTAVPVKREDVKEESRSSPLRHRQTEENRDAECLKTEADKEDCGGPEPARCLSPDDSLKPHTDDKTSDSSEPDTDDSCDWDETRGPASGLNPLQNNEAAVSDVGRDAGKTPADSPGGAVTFIQKGHLQRQNGNTTIKKPFCSVCGKSFRANYDLIRHERVHTGERPYSCPLCGKGFSSNSSLRAHLKLHSDKKTFSCSVCGSSFRVKRDLLRHVRIHTGETLYSCSVCSKHFSRKQSVKRHMMVHQKDQGL